MSATEPRPAPEGKTVHAMAARLKELAEIAREFSLPSVEVETSELLTVLADYEARGTQLEAMHDYAERVEARIDGLRLEARLDQTLAERLRGRHIVARPARVVHVVRAEGPTSEVFAAFLDDTDLERWLAWNRTPVWTHVQIAPLQYPPRQPPAHTTMPPAQWCRAYGVTILDPDGWRHGNAHPWDAPITLAEFFRRAAMSTTDGAKPAWECVSRDLKAQQAAAAPQALPGAPGKLTQRPDWLDEHRQQRELTAEEIRTYRLDHCGTCRDAEFYGWAGTAAEQAHASHREINDVGPLKGTPCRCPKCVETCGRPVEGAGR